jgi:tetratricopeptide (TPR) repeat protein
VEPATDNLEALRIGGGPSVLYLLSIAYLKAGRRGEAREAMEQLFGALAPAQAHFLAGRAYYESTLFEEAAGELEKARAADADVPGLWREIGKAHISLRRSDDARLALREAVRRDPADVEARYFLGALLVQEGVTEGVSLLQQVQQARPDFWGSYYYLGKAALSRPDAAEAVPLLRKAAELRPDDASVLYVLARALKAAGKSEASEQISRRLEQMRARTRDEEQALVAK